MPVTPSTPLVRIEGPPSSILLILLLTVTIVWVAPNETAGTHGEGALVSSSIVRAGHSPLDATPPSAPVNVTAVPHDQAANVTWRTPLSNGGSDITGYMIAWTPASNTTGNDTIGVVTYHWVKGLQNGVTYKFYVAARNRVGTGPFSSPPAQAVPGQVPEAPTHLTVVTGNESASFNWTPPPHEPTYPVNGYILNIFGGGINILYNVTFPSANVSHLVDGIIYHASVRGYNALGTGASSPPITFIPYGPPGRPDGLTLAYLPSPKAIAISWRPPSWTGGATIKNYTIYWSASDGSMGVAHRGPTSTNWNLIGVHAGVRYTINVQATGRGGTGPFVVANITVPATFSSGGRIPSLPLIVMGGAAIAGLAVYALILLLLVRRRHPLPPPSVGSDCQLTYSWAALGPSVPSASNWKICLMIPATG